MPTPDRTPSAASPSRLLSILGHPLVPVTWSVSVAVVYALFPSSDTNAVVAESVWIFGVLVWLLASSRFYIGSDTGIAGQRVSQSGNFSREDG